PLRVVHPGPDRATFSTSRGSRLAGLARLSVLLCLPRQRRLAQCLPGAEATWGCLLVCLPDQRGPHPQALSRTNGKPQALAVRGDGALALARARGRDHDRAGDDAALQPTCSAASTERPGGARTLADCTR